MSAEPLNIEVTWRTMPMIGDSMAPTIRPGDLIHAEPCHTWHGDGLYVLEVLPGCAEVRRLNSDFQGGIRGAVDHPAYTPWVLPAPEVLPLIIGRIMAVSRRLG